MKELVPTVDPTDLRSLIARMSVVDGAARSLEVDSACDWLSSYDRRSGAIVSRALEIVLELELSECPSDATSPLSTIEAALHALAELAEWDLVPRDVLVRVSQLSLEQPWAQEYLSYLRSCIAETKAGMPLQDAYARAQALLDSVVRPDHDLEIVIGSCREFPDAWVFGYNTRQFIEEREFMASLVGNGPVVVPKSGAEPYLGSSGTPIADQLEVGRVDGLAGKRQELP